MMALCAFCRVFLEDRSGNATIVPEEVIMNKLILAALALTLAACAPAAQPAPQPATQATAPKNNPSGITGKTAAAALLDAAGKNVGTVTFAETAGGLRVITRVVSFAPGKYASTVHEGKDCASPNSAPFAAAGGAFKGTMGNLQGFEVGTGGSGIISGLNPRLTIAAGPNSIVSRTVLIKTDKGIVACGEITSTN
jgi:Cu/Zn superoxide dismutase